MECIRVRAMWQFPCCGTQSNVTVSFGHHSLSSVQNISPLFRFFFFFPFCAAFVNLWAGAMHSWHCWAFWGNTIPCILSFGKWSGRKVWANVWWFIIVPPEKGHKTLINYWLHKLRKLLYMGLFKPKIGIVTDLHTGKVHSCLNP